MRMMSLSAAILLGLPLLAAPAFAAPFDGRWIAEMPPEPGPGCGAAVMSVTVVGDTVMGQITSRNFLFRGTLEEDGTGTVSFGHDTGTIRFNGDHFEVNYLTPKCGQRRVLGDRAPSDPTMPAWRPSGSEKQARFAELTRAADWPARQWIIRRCALLYPYTEYWDPYGDRTERWCGKPMPRRRAGITPRRCLCSTRRSNMTSPSTARMRCAPTA